MADTNPAASAASGSGGEIGGQEQEGGGRAAVAGGSGVDATKSDTANSLLTSGRATLFCCLCCGMPYSFPDESYTSGDEDVRDITLFVHRHVYMHVLIEQLRHARNLTPCTQGQAGDKVPRPLQVVDRAVAGV